MYQRATVHRRDRWFLGAGIAVSVSLSVALPFAGAAGDRHPALGFSHSDMTAPAAAETDKKWVSSTSILGDGTVLLWTLPTFSKPILMGRTTLMPYIGAGFSGGYATEVDRSLNTAQFTQLSSSSTTDVGLRSLAGHMVPNEVQVGIRFPF
jgi:hypothetical protein